LKNIFIILLNSYNILNNTAKEITELCDGNNTLEDVINLMKIKYKDINAETIKNDVEQMLLLLDRNELIEWEKNINPFAINEKLYEKEIKDNLKLYKTSPYHFKEIYTLLNTQNYNFKIINPVFLKGIFYNEVSLRHRLFNYSEFFYILKNNIETIAIIGLLDEYPISNKVTLTSCIILNSDISSIFKLLISNLFDDLKDRYSKLKINFFTNHPQKDFITQNLEEMNFIKEAELLHEYNDDENEIIYSKYFI